MRQGDIWLMEPPFEEARPAIVVSRDLGQGRANRGDGIEEANQRRPSANRYVRSRTDIHADQSGILPQGDDLPTQRRLASTSDPMAGRARWSAFLLSHQLGAGFG